VKDRTGMKLKTAHLVTRRQKLAQSLEIVKSQCLVVERENGLLDLRYRELESSEHDS